MNLILIDGKWVEPGRNVVASFTEPTLISIPREVDFGPDLWKRLKEAGDKTPEIDTPDDPD